MCLLYYILLVGIAFREGSNLMCLCKVYLLCHTVNKLFEDEVRAQYFLRGFPWLAGQPVQMWSARYHGSADVVVMQLQE